MQLIEIINTLSYALSYPVLVISGVYTVLYIFFFPQHVL